MESIEIIHKYVNRGHFKHITYENRGYYVRVDPKISKKLYVIAIKWEKVKDVEWYVLGPDKDSGRWDYQHTRSHNQSTFYFQGSEYNLNKPLYIHGYALSNP